MDLLPEEEWTAERDGPDHVIVSVAELNGYLHFARLRLYDKHPRFANAEGVIIDRDQLGAAGQLQPPPAG